MSVKPVAWTPGPWKLTDEGPEVEPTERYALRGADGKWVFTLYPHTNTPAETNLALAESAPELAEALQQAVKALKDVMECDDLSTFNWHDAFRSIEVGSRLLARITPK